MKQYITKLGMGDPSHDGHGKEHSLFIISDFSRGDIIIAFKAGVSKVGFDITECCEDYEDSCITAEQLKLLEDAGFDMSLLWDYSYEQERGMTIKESRISPDEFAAIYLFTASLGNTDFKWSKLEFEGIEIGAYGLFV